VEIFPSYLADTAFRIEFFGDEIDRISEINVVTGEVKNTVSHVAIFPASHYIVPKDRLDDAIADLRKECDERVAFFQANNRYIEAQRIAERTNYDIEMLSEIGFCKGIENYSRVLARREPGSMPCTLLDYFPDDFLFFIDESHVTLPQARGMLAGDRARKESLIDYGFRLPSALDNRPLSFDELYSKINQVIYISATPGEFEREHASQIVEQVIRPTGLLDPMVSVRPVEGQIDDLLSEINERAAKKERVLITTLTKKMAEDLTAYLEGMAP
jgi:excinuclease ABC subunit B